MNRKKHLKWMASLLIVMLAGACSTGEDEEMLLEQSINIPDTDNAGENKERRTFALPRHLLIRYRPEKEEKHAE